MQQTQQKCDLYRINEFYYCNTSNELSTLQIVRMCTLKVPAVGYSGMVTIYQTTHRCIPKAALLSEPYISFNPYLKNQGWWN
jgi:hypothetical protein